MSTNKQRGLRRSLRLGVGCLFASLVGVAIYAASQQAATWSAFVEHCEIVSVPLPTGGAKSLLAWKPYQPDRHSPIMTRLLAQTNELRTITLSLRAPPPFLIEVSTNLVDWSFFDSSTNEVATITICAEQQTAIPFAFFRPKPASALARRLWR